MKRLWFAVVAVVVFFFGNLGITRSIDIRFQSASPPDVCDCATICKMHLTCDVPKCNGRVAQESDALENTDSPTDETTDDPQQQM